MTTAAPPPPRRRRKTLLQWINGPDACDNNLVKGNRIATSGNECVDIKEGATGNVIEDNICSHQLDTESGCYDSRGDGNTFRYVRMYLCTHIPLFVVRL